jgi:hypothetical protein
MTMRAPPEREALEITKAARQLLAGRAVGDEPLRRSATVRRALPVRTPGGRMHSWCVPLTVKDRLAAIFQLLPGGTLMRFSAFYRRPGEFDACPPAADWLDTGRIQARAAAQRRKDEKAGEPFLTFDRSPDRLVWAVPVTDARGQVRLLYVAGESVYAPPPGETLG